MIKKRGQVTIFIIIAILVIAIVALFFILREKVEKAPAIPEVINPNSFLKTCIEDTVEDTIEVLSMQGGYMGNPLSINFKFGSEDFWDISYLCYTSANDLCVVQQPSIINNMERELKQELSDELEFCFGDLVKSYERSGYDINKKEYNTFEANLIEDSLIIELLDAELTMTKADQTLRHKSFKMEFPTKLYNLGKVVHIIIESETKGEYFDRIDYMRIYPDYDIDPPFVTDDNSKIYTIKHMGTKEKFRFAVRGVR